MISTEVVTNHGFMGLLPAASGVTPGGLIDFAIHNHYTHLWIMPGAGQLGTLEYDQAEYDIKQYQNRRTGRCSSMVGRRLSPRTRNVRVIFLENSDWKLPADVSEVKALIGEIEMALGVPMAGSPTSVGLRYLEKVDERYYKRYFSKDAETDYDALKEVFTPSIAWFPAPQPGQLAKKYLHCYDRNGSHPYAASQLSFGIGAPTYEEEGEFYPGFPGFWDVSLVGDPEEIANKLGARQLPPLLPAKIEWLSTSLVKMLIRAKIDIRVERAIYWKKKAPIFERWARNLWERRQQATGALERAYKQIMNNTMGAMRQGSDLEVTFRPDWYASFVAEERAIVWYRAWQRWLKTGLAPVGCYADALYYATDSADPGAGEMAGIPGEIAGMLDHRKSFGGYKHVWTLEITDEVRAVLVRKLSPSDKIGELKKIVRRQANVG